MVIHADYRATAVESLKHHVPVAFALLKVWLEVGKVGTGTLGCACSFHLRSRARRLVVECHRAHRDDEGTRHGQGQLIGVADQVIHSGQTEIARILAHREELQDRFGTPRLAKTDIPIPHARSDFQIGYLLAQWLIGVPVNRRYRSAGEQASMVEEICNKVEQIVRSPVMARQMG